jgi:hypothetical protein
VIELVVARTKLALVSDAVSEYSNARSGVTLAVGPFTEPIASLIPAAPIAMRAFCTVGADRAAAAVLPENLMFGPTTLWFALELSPPSFSPTAQDGSRPMFTACVLRVPEFTSRSETLKSRSVGEPTRCHQPLTIRAVDMRQPVPGWRRRGWP